jgi:mannose-6-phosphate isomerase
MDRFAMQRLENVVQSYAWGSRTAIAELRGQPPASKPEAELWMGAHPSAPSRVSGTSLLDLIIGDPEAMLGARSVAAFGDRLPFLFKVLAADDPLSLQAHPTVAQAQEGFAREEAAGIPRDAAHRNYRDHNHKPELLCALGPFDALCGFREISATRRLFQELQLALELESVRDTFSAVMRRDVRALVAAVGAACEHYSGTEFQRECAWVARLAEKHPGDGGVIGALMLNLVHLEEGEAIYLPAGNLHAYLHGVGVEIMANSDNVLRGGMTPKHVDVDELIRVLDFRDGPIEKVVPQRRGNLDVWETPAREFELSRARLDGEIVVPVHAATIVLCTEGSLVVRDDEGASTLARGDAGFVRGSSGSLALLGTGTAFLATSLP